jgi:hypothetical protein
MSVLLVEPVIQSAETRVFKYLNWRFWENYFSLCMSDMQVATSNQQTLDLSDACDSHNTDLLSRGVPSDIVTWLETGDLYTSSSLMNLIPFARYV